MVSSRDRGFLNGRPLSISGSISSERAFFSKEAELLIMAKVAKGKGFLDFRGIFL
jgi:hypothetical protein